MQVTYSSKAQFVASESAIVSELKSGAVCVVDKMVEPSFAEALYLEFMHLGVFKKMLGIRLAGSERAQHVDEDEWARTESDARMLSFSVLCGSRGGRHWGLECLLPELCYGAVPRALSVGVYPLLEPSIEVHSMRAGDFIGFHSDARDGRLISGTIYLTPVWEAEMGGNLVFADAGISIEPVLGRLVLFDVERAGKHRVTPVNGIATAPRVSVSVWWRERVAIARTKGF